jgi:hypothetical protein
MAGLWVLFLMVLCALFVLKSLGGLTRSGLKFSVGQQPRGWHGVLLSIVSLTLMAGLIAMIAASTRIYAFENGPGALQWSLGSGMVALGTGCFIVGFRSRQKDLCFCGIALGVLGVAFVYPPHLQGSRSYDRLEPQVEPKTYAVISRIPNCPPS